MYNINLDDKKRESFDYPSWKLYKVLPRLIDQSSSLVTRLGVNNGAKVQIQ